MRYRMLFYLRRCVLGRLYYRRRRNRMGDVYVLSFPKAGRTWLRVMLTRALQLHFGIKSDELAPLQQLAVDNPRVPRIRFRHDDNPQFKTPDELVTRKTEFGDCKVIIMIRDIRDLCVSAYFQMTRREVRFEGSISDYIRNRRGSVDSMIRFYNIWARNRHVPADFMLIRYEDLHADAPGHLKKVLDFLGATGADQDTIRRAVEFAQFENMRKLELADAAGRKWLRPGQKGDVESYKTRRGKIGGYANYISEADVEMINQKIRDHLDPMYGYVV